MRRSLAFVFLVATSTVAIAQWTPIPKSSADTTQYIDTSSVERSGSSVKLLWLNDLATPEYVRRRKSSKTYSSQIFHAEYDCEKKQYRILKLTLFSGQMANGERFANITDGPWRDISDGYEMWRVTWRIACTPK